MLRIQPRTLAGSLLFATALTLAPSALAGDGEDAFFRAYFLEHEEGDLRGALELYKQVATDRDAPEELRKRAKANGRACAEELAASDFARLMPKDSIVYVELNRPGDQLGRLLEQTGLLQGSEGSGSVAISPRLVKGLLGVRGAAIAITGIDPNGGPPSGVVVVHPGDMDVVRGLIETALPVGGQPTEAIGGYPTWNIEGEVFVTSTDRLIIASSDRDEISDVVSRMKGQSRDSLASNEALAETMQMRGNDLLFFCVNAEPIMPMVQAIIAQQAGNSPEVAMAMALLDIESTRALAGRVGVDDQGISLDFGLQLDEGHRNVAFNLMRQPNLNERSLELVPSGTAFFAVSSLNEPSQLADSTKDGKGDPVVTFMDFGREVFANVVDVAVFAMPSTSPGPGGQPIPDIALSLSVNDASRSRALWNLCLGVAKGAAGSGEMKPQEVKIGGANCERYEIEGVSIYLYAKDDRVVISPSDNAMEAAIQASRRGKSVLDDGLYAGALASLGSDQTSAMALSPGRIARIAKSYVPEREMAQIAPYLGMLDHTVFVATQQQSATRLAISARLDGLPRVGGIVSELVRQKMHGGRMSGAWSPVVAAEQAHTEAVRALAQHERALAEHEHAARAAAAAEQHDREHEHANDDLEIVIEDSASDGFSDAKSATRGGGEHTDKEHAERAIAGSELRKAFEYSVDGGKIDAARKILKAFGEQYSDDALELNNLAWALLTEEQYGGKFFEEALALSARSNEVSGFGNWFYLDTLGHALHATGKLEKAVAVQRKAVEIAGDDERAADAKKSLRIFEKALAESGKDI